MAGKVNMVKAKASVQVSLIDGEIVLSDSSWVSAHLWVNACYNLMERWLES
jgi:hypothetical protein